MLEPISIKEIQEKTQKAQNTIIDNDIQNINNLIDKAAAGGDTTATYKGVWRSKVLVKLAEIYKKEGYGVDTAPGSITIMWQLP